LPPNYLNLPSDLALRLLWAKQELEENEEYVEREDEFDFQPDEAQHKVVNPDDNEDEEVDIDTVERYGPYSDSDMCVTAPTSVLVLLRSEQCTFALLTCGLQFGEQFFHLMESSQVPCCMYWGHTNQANNWSTAAPVLLASTAALVLCPGFYCDRVSSCSAFLSCST
jgi:hypothetical protein